jgi:hypothetical protein
MTEKRIDQLRDILTSAAARDRELESALETFATDVMKDLGGTTSPLSGPTSRLPRESIR